MANVDTATLATIINQCFSLSMDQAFSGQDQAGFLVEGKRLRGQLLNLLSAQFDAGCADLIAANNSLKAINADLSDRATVLANAATTLNNIATLVSNLDKLLALAAGFL